MQNKETDWSKRGAFQSQEQKDDYHDNCVFRQCSSVVRRFPFELFVRARWPKRVLRRAGYLIHMAVYPQFQRWISAVAPHHICYFRHDSSYEGRRARGGAASEFNRNQQHRFPERTAYITQQ